MSLDSQLDLHKALFAHIRADTQLYALLGQPLRLYDQRPQGVEYPYLMLQRSQMQPVEAEGRVDEIAMTFLCVSRFDGTEEVKAILAQLRHHLEGADLSLSAHKLVNLRISFVDVFRASDRRTFYGLMRLRAVCEKV